MRVVIAEKPSVGAMIAGVLGAKTRADGYFHDGQNWCVTWALGHLVEIYTPLENGTWVLKSLPIIPEKFQLRPRKEKGRGGKTDSGAAHQIEIIRRLFSKCSEIIVATDAGREGELIFRYIYEYLECDKPFRRLWVQSMEESDIRQAFANLEDGHSPHLEGLYRAAKARNEADWLVGINATRAFTLTTESTQVLSLGRVQTPVLSIICQRYVENKTFKPEPFWFLEGESEKDGIRFKWRSENRYAVQEDGIRDRDAVLSAGYVEVAEMATERVTRNPPLPHDIASLQKAANTRYGYTADETLAAAQSLYEKRLITYPRTGSRYITDSVFDSVPALLQVLEQDPDYGRIAASLLSSGRLNRRCVNAEKVTDHHALLVTSRRPGDLSETEEKVYDLVVSRFLEAFCPPNVADVTTVHLQSNGVAFITKGRKEVFPGWRGVCEGSGQSIELEDVDGIDMNMRPLPVLAEGEQLGIDAFSLIEDETKPKPLYTDATLITAMENAGQKSDIKEVSDALKDIGIGTPATRHEIIKTLVARQYVERQKKKIVPTQLGLLVYASVRNLAVASVELTARWEISLEQIADGEIDEAVFGERVRRYTEKVTDNIRKSDGFGKIREVLGKKTLKCPRCGREIRLMEKSAWCPSCKYTIWRDIAGKVLNDDSMKALLTKGETRLLSGFKSKTGKTFDAHVIVDENGQKSFRFDKRSS